MGPVDAIIGGYLLRSLVTGTIWKRIGILRIWDLLMRFERLILLERLGKGRGKKNNQVMLNAIDAMVLQCLVH